MNPYAIAAICAASLATGWIANGWRLGEQMQSERNEWSAAEQRRRDEADARALEVWVADQHAQKEITNRENRLSEFERCIAAGRGCGLRVRVKACPGVPTGETAGVGAGAEQTAELAPELGPDYRALRAGIGRLEEALKVCVSASAQ